MASRLLSFLCFAYVTSSSVFENSSGFCLVLSVLALPKFERAGRDSLTMTCCRCKWMLGSSAIAGHVEEVNPKWKSSFSAIFFV